MKHPFLILVVVLLALGGAWLFREYSSSSGDTPLPPRTPVPVSVFTATEREISYRTEALGTLYAAESVDITASVNEIITELRFNDGAHVQKGAVLAQLEHDEELALLAEARVNLAEQEREVQRLQDLVGKRSASQSELDQRIALRDRARYQVQAIEARIRNRIIRAPFDGQLGLRRLSVGALVSPGTVITTLDDMRTMKLDFNVPATLLASLAVGQAVTARSAAFEQDFNGVVTAIDSRINPVDRSILVRAEFPNPDNLLKPGLLMQVVLSRHPRRALVIPEESLLSREDRHYVWVVDHSSLRVSEQEVELGGRQPGWVEIVDGLEPGALVIREGFMTVSPGDIVSIPALGAG